MSCYSYNDLCSCSRTVPAFVPIQQNCCPPCPDPCHPCPPCPPCPDPCHPCPPCPPPYDRRIPSYAFYYTNASQNVAAGQPVVFSAGSSTSDIVLSGGNLLFNRPGIYLIQYKIAFTGPAASTTVSLALNGVPVAGSSAVTTTTDTEYSGQAIACVPSGGIVSLTVSAASVIASASITAVRIA